MTPRSFFLILIAAIVALVAAAYVPTPRQDVAVLDRLAPQLERMQTLPPETRDAIKQLVDRARVSTGDPRYDARRSVTIERVIDAIRARDGGEPELSGTVGQSPLPK